MGIKKKFEKKKTFPSSFPLIMELNISTGVMNYPRLAILFPKKA